MNTKAGRMNAKNVVVVHFETFLDISLENICWIFFLVLLGRINQKYPYLLIPLSIFFFSLFFKLNEQWNYPITLTLETLRKGLDGIFFDFRTTEEDPEQGSHVSQQNLQKNSLMTATFMNM